MYYFTSDEHYDHFNIIAYCKRPFHSVTEMQSALIDRHNSIVKTEDIVIHAGDFCFQEQTAKKIIPLLNGKHIFIRGSHDSWLHRKAVQIWEKKIENILVVVCHYSMRTWPKSHYNSWQLYGHSHGRLAPMGKQHDIGVDNNNFFPVSFEKLKMIMEQQPNNPHYIDKKLDSKEYDKNQ